MNKNKEKKIYFSNEPAIKINKNNLYDKYIISRYNIFKLFLINFIFFLFIIIYFNFFKIFIKSSINLNENQIISDKYLLNNNKKNRTFIPVSKIDLNENIHSPINIKKNINIYNNIQNKNLKFIYIPLAKKYKKNIYYPKFNPLDLFINKDENLSIKKDIYKKNVDTEVVFKKYSLIKNNNIKFDVTDHLNDEEIEQSLNYAEYKFLKKHNNFDEIHGLYYKSNNDFKIKIYKENVSEIFSYSKKYHEDYFEDIILFNENDNINILKNFNYSQENISQISQILKKIIKRDKFIGKSIIRIGTIKNYNGIKYILRFSIYKNKKHIITIAKNDYSKYVLCKEPESNYSINKLLNDNDALFKKFSQKFPKVYDAIYQSILSYNMTLKNAKYLINILANDIDMQSNVSIKDYIEILYSVDYKDNKKKVDIFYLKAVLNGKIKSYYRFLSKNGMINYYDSEGKGSKKFLLRKPVPNGIFKSPFGIRRHPIFGYTRMHTGIDWAATKGSIIISAGDGEVIIAEWIRGYGYHTKIRHAHGYISSYSHQSKFFYGIRPGKKVYQGQAIGYVGSTGFSTGPHCHFEIIANGIKIDPININLPDNNILTGNDLELFKRNKNSIDKIISNNT